jgi:DNA topoisomerase IA
LFKTIPHATHPHHLADLQNQAWQEHGMLPQQTLDAATGLYEKGLITYPRVASRFLPANGWPQASRVAHAHQLASGRLDLDPARQARCWVQELPCEHQGIVPTDAPLCALFGVELPLDERRLHALILVRFLGLFIREP